MKKILLAMLIATMMLMALSVAEDATKSTTVATTSTTPGSDATKSTTTVTSSAPGTDTKSTTTTTTTPGFEATFAVAGILAVTFIALRKRR
jgi:PGF-CTERM protein